MFLYNLTLQRASAITHVVHGNFSGTKTEEIVISRGKILELLCPDPNTGKIHTLLSNEIFGVIHSLKTFRPVGSSKDYVIVGSDFNRIVILEYISKRNVFEKIQETFAKLGTCRHIPCHYLAVDPHGRSIMIGALEKQKLAYILNFETETELASSSPLEVPENSSLVYDIVSIDMSGSNPIFACLEIDCGSDGEAPQKTQQTLTFHELDLYAKDVIHKYSEPLEEHANLLISVPGGNSVPSGVLICFENYIMYKNLDNQDTVRCPIPRRINDLDDPERGIIFVCSTTYKTESNFFFFAQTEQGDIFKITLDITNSADNSNSFVTEIKMKYFDTVPVASGMCILQAGFLFVAAEFGNHHFYQIPHIEDYDDELEFSSLIPLEEGETFFFTPRPLRNLVLVDEMLSLSPIMSCKVADLAGEDTPQLYMLCGRGPRSTLKVLRHGIGASEMAVSELQDNPTAVWTVKGHSDDWHDAYIIVSFTNNTLVFSIGENIEEVTDSGFLGTTPTLACGTLENNALIQVYPGGVRRICCNKSYHDFKRVKKPSQTIVKCAINQKQVVIALNGGEVVYFEIDPSLGLQENHQWKKMNVEVACLSLADILPGEHRSRFLVIALKDGTVQILSLDLNDFLSQRSTKALPACAESLCIVTAGGTDSDPENASTSSNTLGLYLNIGLQNGILLRTGFNPASGHLFDIGTRNLGSEPVKLFKIRTQKTEVVLAVSSRPWLSFYHQNHFCLTPLSYENLEYATAFSSERCPDGIIAIYKNTLRILALGKLDTVFNHISYPLGYTPRKFVVHKETSNLILIETDSNAYTEESKQLRRTQLAEVIQETADDEELAKEMAASYLNDSLPENIFSAPKSGEGMWASTIKFMDPRNGTVYKHIPLEQNEAATSICLLKFHKQLEHHWYLIVGIAKNMELNTRLCDTCFLDTYTVDENCCELKRIHRTPVNDVPSALCPYDGRLLVGIGNTLGLYDLGKKKLLRKCANEIIPNFIVDIQTTGKRIFVSDVQESVFVFTYKQQTNRLIVVAEDSISRWITSTAVLDYDTIATADKFGNITVIRLLPNVTEDVDEYPNANKAFWDRGLLHGALQKAESVATFHIGEICTSLQKVSLKSGGGECLLYTTLCGSVGILVPFTSLEDHSFFQSLEMHIRKEYSSFCGRDHSSFRSYYYPLKNVIDGDLCEQFNTLGLTKQNNIIRELGQTPAEVLKKLEDIRSRCAF